MKRFILVLMILLTTAVSVFAQVDEGLPKGRVTLFDGFENGNYWIWAGFDWDQYGTHKFSSGANLSMDWASEGRHSLELTMEPMPADKAKSAVWFYDGTNDLTGTRYIAVDIYNPEEYTYSIAAVIQATDSWKWCQTTHYQVSPGVHTLVFDVTKYTEYLHDVRRLTLTHDGWQETTRDTHIYVDNIRLIK